MEKDIKEIIPQASLASKEDEDLLKFLDEAKPKIAVVGTGGSGCNTLTRMSELGVHGARFIAMNTDVQHLIKMRSDKKVLIGKKTTKGMGAGSDPKLGEEAAKESAEEIKSALGSTSLLFITCGLGGGTGTGSAPVIAEQAKSQDALVVSVVTLPFTSEGKQRRANALGGLAKLKKHCDTVIVVPNDKLLSIVPELPLNTAFKVSDEVLAGSVKGIAEMVTKAGLVNLDFADLRTILKGAGCAVVGMGEASLESSSDERALVAIETALNSPLIDVDITTATKALINVTGGSDMTLREAELMVAETNKRIAPDSHIIWGARVEDNLPRNAIRVLTVIAGAEFPQYELDQVKAEELDIELDEIS
ncbi:cell division protein FtsZ [Candidatus Micrarchaeota archaeon]|nr:MAG: cell division protein FtsZ [Candidatus Micrarchaeota archaeon]